MLGRVLTALCVAACGGQTQPPSEPVKHPSVDRADASAEATLQTQTPRYVTLADHASSRWLGVGGGWVVYVDLVNGLMRVPKAGGVAVAIAPASMVGEPTELVVDGATVYFAPKRGLYRVDPPSAPVSIGPGPNGSVACLAVGATSVAWFDLRIPDVWAGGGEVKEAPKAGGPARTLTAFRTPDFGCVAAFGDTVFALSFDETRGASGTVMAFTKGTTRKLAHGIDAPPLHMKADAQAVYWREDRAIRSVRQSGGPVASMTPPEGCTDADYTVSDGHIYYACSAAIWSVARSAGTPVAVVENEPDVASPIVDEDSIYWTANRLIKRAPLPR